MIVERFLADLHAMYPQTRASPGVIVRPVGAGQRLLAARAAVALQPALEGALGAHENLHLAGDYLAELGTMEAAARTGLRGC